MKARSATSRRGGVERKHYKSIVRCKRATCKASREGNLFTLKALKTLLVKFLNKHFLFQFSQFTPPITAIAKQSLSRVHHLPRGVLMRLAKVWRNWMRANYLWNSLRTSQMSSISMSCVTKFWLTYNFSRMPIEVRSSSLREIRRSLDIFMRNFSMLLRILVRKNLIWRRGVWAMSSWLEACCSRMSRI